MVAGRRVLAPPDLDSDELATGAVVVAEAIGHTLADDVVRFPGREPSDVSVLVVVGEHVRASVALGTAEDKTSTLRPRRPWPWAERYELAFPSAVRPTPEVAFEPV